MVKRKRPTDIVQPQLNGFERPRALSRGYAHDPLYRERRELAEQGLKRCITCAVIKPFSNFYAYTSARKDRCVGGVTNECKDCALVRFRRSFLKRAYGITPEDYDALFTAQAYACGICGAPGKSVDTMTRDHRRTGSVSGVLTVDHNHETGAVRGLLCNSCNRGLGYFANNPKTLQSAIEYLLKDGADAVTPLAKTQVAQHLIDREPSN